MSLPWYEVVSVARHLAMHLEQETGLDIDPIEVRIKLEKEIKDCEKKKASKKAQSASPT